MRGGVLNRWAKGASCGGNHLSVELPPIGPEGVRVVEQATRVQEGVAGGLDDAGQRKDSNADVAILDGYIDEPSLFGVPPYLSPYPRLVAGAVRAAGMRVSYTTIDQVRKQPAKAKALQEAPMLVVIGGLMVPGRYVRGLPASVRELRQLLPRARGTVVLGGGMARYGMLGGGPLSTVVHHAAAKDVDALVADLLAGQSDPRARYRTLVEWDRFALLGAHVASLHPDFPTPLTVEVDLYRGCVRVPVNGGCHFCTEVALGHPRVRPPASIVAELRQLQSLGVRNVRLAGACVYSYDATVRGDRLAVNAPAVQALFDGIAAGTSLEVLHIDNGDPAMVIADPQVGAAVTALIVRTCTSGNVVSFGLESADRSVQKANNLNATPEQVHDAVEVINRIGGVVGPSGLPALLPGINFLSGLREQTGASFHADLAFLRSLRDEGLLLRRINLRQVLDLRGEFAAPKLRTAFQRFKRAVRTEIDQPMLRRLAPTGRVLRGLHFEFRQGALGFWRQVGSYPLLVGIPDGGQLPRDRAAHPIDAAVTGHGFRSLSAVPYPLQVSAATKAQLQALPGVGAKRAHAILRSVASGADPLAPLSSEPDLCEQLRPFLAPAQP